MENGVLEIYVLIPSHPFIEVFKYGWNSVALLEIYG
jgi:hypothetical protein